MNGQRRYWVIALVAAFVGTTAPRAVAESYPTRPVTLIVPSSAGGITDFHARIIAGRLERALGQPLIVENRSGASGIIGMAAAANARADGYTIVLGSISNLTVAPALGMPIPYDPLKSFEPIIYIGSTPMVLLAHPSLGVRTVHQLVASAKAKPGNLSYGTGGAMTVAHFAGELFKRTAGINLLHVPYRGSMQALIAVLGNEVPLGIDFPDTCAPLVAAGKLRALLVTGSRRVEILPGVPQAVEQGFPQLDLLAWGGFFAPAGTLRQIIQRLNEAISKILGSDTTRLQLQQGGWKIGGGSPENLQSLVKAEQAKWAGLVKLTGISMEH